MELWMYLSLKYQSLTSFGCKDIWIRESYSLAVTQFLLMYVTNQSPKCLKTAWEIEKLLIFKNNKTFNFWKFVSSGNFSVEM